VPFGWLRIKSESERERTGIGCGTLLFQWNGGAIGDSRITICLDFWGGRLEEGRPMERFALRDDQWYQIKDILPRREGHVGGTAADNRLFVEAVLSGFEPAFRGAIRRSGSVAGRARINGSADGRKAGFSSIFSSCWRAMPTMNT
jgi:hypothetical protein